MSIWCSGDHVGTDQLFPEEGPNRGNVLTYAEGFSNHYPDLDGSHELPAEVNTAVIAPWCVPGHDEDCEPCGRRHDHPESGDWIRLSVHAREGFDFWSKPPKREPVDACVVLDREAARALAADLLAWADGPTVTRAAAGGAGDAQDGPGAPSRGSMSLRVTPTQKRAAEVVQRRREQQGRDVPASLRKIADARPFAGDDACD